MPQFWCFAKTKEAVKDTWRPGHSPGPPQAIPARPDCKPRSQLPCNRPPSGPFPLPSWCPPPQHLGVPSAFSPAASCEALAGASALLVSLLNSEGSRFLARRNRVALQLRLFLLSPSALPTRSALRTALRVMGLLFSTFRFPVPASGR